MEVARKVIVICCVVVAGLALPARADWIYDVATLQCAPDRNEALVRIGAVHNKEAPQWHDLPESLSPHWPADPEADNKTCQLANGQKVEIQGTVGQTFAYGMNGGEPAYWVSLWIDRKTVLSRQLVRAGYVDQSGNDVSVILVTSDRLRICDHPNSLPPYKSKLEAYAKLDRDAEGCFTKELDLESQPLDPVQMAEDVQLGTYTVAATYSEAFCRKFIVPDDDVAVLQEWIGIFSAAHFYRSAFEVFHKFNKFVAWYASGVRVIVTKTICRNTEAESAVTELPAFQVSFDVMLYAHCS